MKLIVQIPARDEESTLPDVLADIPREIDGVDSIEILVIDDGSTDRTAEVARAGGAEVIRLPGHQGLARAFQRGLHEALRRGADAIVNTDADGQYAGADIPVLIAPVLAGEADLVVGDRQVKGGSFFPWWKRLLQRWGSGVVRRLSGTTIPDATSGFRAYARETALRISVLSRFSYTLETLIQAGYERMRIVSVPIRRNPDRRPSRLFRSHLDYVLASLNTMLRVYTMYRPLRVFATLGALVALPGVLLGLRFLAFYLAGQGGGHVQSLILSAVLVLLGFLLGVAGLLADVLSANRRLLEELLYRQRRMEFARDTDGSGGD